MVTLGSAPKVLVLEDEPIIALDIEGILTDAGLDVTATLASCAGALEWLKANRPDVAILDIDLQDGSCELVAQRLLDLGVPLVIFSGSDPTESTIDPVFLKGAWRGKPAPSEKIVEAVRAQLLQSAWITRADRRQRGY
ncbi:MAG: response regulator [Bosea sp. (in: a-proteobacteria)]|nr:response regulator [Bosea sp. (in: a-proteobacteria)]